jgi:preprotein translocase subunit SecB
LPSERPLNQLGQLRDAFLSRVEFSRNFEFEFGENDITFGVAIESSSRPGSAPESWFLDLTADLEWYFEDGETSPAVPFDLTLTVSGAFEWLGETDHAGLLSAEDWLLYNGEVLLWPYLRSYVQQITGASDMPAVVLYTMGVPYLDQESENRVGR